jgi:hypothetical protein
VESGGEIKINQVAKREKKGEKRERFQYSR